MSENIEVMEFDAYDLVVKGSIAERVQENKIKGDQFIQRLSEILAEYNDKKQKL